MTTRPVAALSNNECGRWPKTPSTDPGSGVIFRLAAEAGVNEGDDFRIIVGAEGDVNKD